MKLGALKRLLPRSERARFALGAALALVATLLVVPGLVSTDRASEAPRYLGVPDPSPRASAPQADPYEIAGHVPPPAIPGGLPTPATADAAYGEEAAEDGAPGFDCLIEPSERVVVGSAETGVLAAVHFDRSDLVEAGSVVAELESDVEQAEVRLARQRASLDTELRSAAVAVDLGSARKSRADELFQGNVLSLDIREEVDAEAKIAELELKKAKERKRLAKVELERSDARLQRRVIRTPISGVVVDRKKSPGEVVKEEGILTIAQIDPLRVEVILPAGMFGQLEPGMRAEVMPETPADGVYAASVSLVDRVIDPASGTFGARLELPNPDHAIPSGLHCTVSFLADANGP